MSIADGFARLAATYLAIDGALYIYGPFKLNGQYTALSNEEFDKTLLSYKVPEWGLKDVADITNAFEQHGLRLQEKVSMPSHNFILVYGF